MRPGGLWTRITSIEQSSEPTLVYNLEVEGNHNYFVGEIGVLSHNCNGIMAVKELLNKAKPAEKIGNGYWNYVDDYVSKMTAAGNKWVGDPALVTKIDGQLYLVDGHHRVHAARELGVDVVYEMIDPADLPSRIFRTAEQIVQDARSAGGWSTRP